MNKITLFITSSLLLTACQSVPSTKLTLNPNTGGVTLDSPKDVGWSNLDVTIPNGGHWVISGYKAVNNPADLAIIAQANAQMAQTLSDLVKTLVSTGAARAGSGGLVP